MNTENKLKIQNSKFKTVMFLFLIILLAAILRLWHLGQYPIHLTNDEAGIGYNAYSILKTARDEHGQFMPIVFESFGDWKPGLYIYLTVPSVLLFGLTEFAVRLPSALSGVASVYLLYLIANRLFDRNVALASAFILAILPWHMQFSRGAWEANAALMILLAGVWFFIKSLKNHNYIVLSAAFFGLTLWTYQSAKLASVLVLLALAICYHKKLLSLSKKTLGTSVVIGILVAMPIVLSLFSGKGGRLEVMSVFSYTRPDEYIKETILDQEDISKNSLKYLLFHSEAANLTRGITGRYFNYFSGKFLFFQGDWSSLRHSIPNVGYLLFAEAPVFIVGLVQLFKSKGDKNATFVLLWLAFAPIAPALTRDSVHGVRALNMVAPLSIVLGIGINSMYSYLKKQINPLVKYIMAFLITGAFIYSFVIYLDGYYIQNEYVYAENYFYGYRETVKELDKISEDKKVVFSQSYDQPYIYFLFYKHYDPDKYQQVSNFIPSEYGDVGIVTKLDNIEFRPINWSSDIRLENTLIVGKLSAFPTEEVDKPEDYDVTRIKYPNGNDAFLIVEAK